MPPTQSDVLPSGEEEFWPSPIQDGDWTDADGTWWQLRGPGQEFPLKRLKKLLLSPEIRVLLFYGPGEPSEIGSDHRQALWQRMQPYLTGRPARAKGDFTDFDAAEFKDDKHRRLLIIQEYC